MLRSHRLPLLLVTAGLLTPTLAHAEEPGTVAAPAPEAAAPAPAPVAAAPAPTPVAAAPAPTPEVAAPAPAAVTPAEVAPASDAIAAPEITSPTDPEGRATAAPPAAVALPTPAAAAKAPVDPYTHVPFNLGLFPPLSINGSHRNQKIRNTISVALLWSRVDRLEGVAAAMGMTIVDEDARGITWGMVGNITRGEHQGIQATHGYNHAGNLRGIQVGAINHANEARGVQAGLINVGRGRVRGMQIGLINYAEEADASFALIPVTKKGGVRPEVWTSDTAAINVGLRLPANYTYAFFAGGLHPVARRQPPASAQADAEAGGDRSRTDGMALMAGMGFGGHLPVTDEVGLDGDISGWVVTSGLRAGPELASLTKLRAMVSWQLRPRLAVWGGPTLNVMVDRADDGVPRPGYGWVAGSNHEVDGLRIRWWPGFAAGLRF